MSIDTEAPEKEQEKQDGQPEQPEQAEPEQQQDEPTDEPKGEDEDKPEGEQEQEQAPEAQRAKRPARRRPGRPPKDGKTAKKKPALYHLYEEAEDKSLTPVGDQEAKTAEGAVTAFLKGNHEGDTKEFVDAVRSGDAIVVAIPERNYTVVGAEEEVKTRLRIKARK
jgi:hypothetical protein